MNSKFSFLFSLMLLITFSCNNDSQPVEEVPPPRSRVDILCGQDAQCRSLANLYLDNIKTEPVDPEIQTWMKNKQYCHWQGVTCNTQGEVEELDLSGGIEKHQLTSLSENVFIGLPKLRKLLLSYNYFHRLQPNSLVGLSSLEILSLDACEIEELPDSVFNPLISLKILGLGGNKIPFISKSLFNKNSQLQELLLYKDHIQNIDEEAFITLHELQKLDLRDNQIQFIAPLTLSELKKLQFLYVGNNYLSTLDSKILGPSSKFSIFAENLLLEELDLSNNNFVTIKKAWFSYSKNLTYLRLENNQINQIDEQAFTELVQLTDLQLSNNLLKWNSLPLAVFAKNKNLLYLSISDNPLGDEKGLQVEWFQSLTNLVDLNLSNTHIKTLPLQGFKALSNLGFLNLDDNLITEITDPTVFEGLSFLVSLGLEGNQIKTLEKNILSKLPSLEYLSLSKNPIVTIKEDAFYGLGMIKNIKIEATQLTDLTQTQLKGLESVETFSFSENKEAESFGPNIFDHFTKLNLLLLESNPKLNWDATMSSLCAVGRVPSIVISTLGSAGVKTCAP